MPKLIAAVAFLMGLPLFAADQASEPQGRVLTEAQFNDSVMYGRTKPGEARAWLISTLDAELRTVQQTYSLTDDQVAKVRTAGERDIKEWFEAVEKSRAKYTRGQLTPEQLIYAQMEMTKLRMAPQTDLFGKSSFYQMAVSDAVTVEQRRAFEQRLARKAENVQPAAPAAPAVPVQRVVAANAANAIQVIAGDNGEQLYVVSEQYFDTRVFGNATPNLVLSQQLSSSLKREAGDLATRCELTSEQRKKIELAGKGDIKNWFDRAETLRAAVTTEPLERVRYTELSRQMQGLAMERQSGLFGDSSLFRKTLLRMLEVEQRQKLEHFDRERRLQLITSALANFQQRAPASRLSDAGRKKVAEYLVDKCRDSAITGSYGMYVIMLQADECSNELIPLISADEWNALHAQIQSAKQVEPALRQMGVWPPKKLEDE